MQTKTERKQGESRSKASWTIFNCLSYMNLEFTGRESEQEDEMFEGTMEIFKKYQQNQIKNPITHRKPKQNKANKLNKNNFKKLIQAYYIQNNGKLDKKKILKSLIQKRYITQKE